MDTVGVGTSVRARIDVVEMEDQLKTIQSKREAGSQVGKDTVKMGDEQSCSNGHLEGGDKPCLKQHNGGG